MARIVKKLKLSATQLAASQPVKALGFKSTDELKAFVGILGQERATTAIQFGVAMNRSGYNIYVMGESGTGRMTHLKRYLQDEAQRYHSADDWLYINNFDSPKAPKALNLPAGVGRGLHKDLEGFIDKLLMTFPAAFENPTYQQKKSAIERAFNRKYDQAIDQVEQVALKRNIAVYRDATSLSFTPLKDGKGMDETEFAQLPDKKREKINNDISELETLLNDALLELPSWKRDSNEELEKLNKQTIDNALAPLLRGLRKTYSKYKDVLSYFDALAKDLHRTIIDIFSEERAAEVKDDASRRSNLEELYLPNLLVAHDSETSAPVVYESHPNYKNLFGRVEYTSEMGALITNYHQICPGALHRANGGYLLVDASKLLEEPFVWDAMKRALKERELDIESPFSELGMIGTSTLTPQKIALNVKVILVGPREVYYLLQQLDPDFHEMFRVLVDFDDHIERNDDTVHAFARLLKSRCEAEKYPALTASAVARMVEQSSRLVENQHQLSAKIGELFDLLAEADYIRQLSDSRKINHDHVNKALDAKAERTGRVSQLILNDMLDGAVLIDTAGEQVGKINGLTVLSVGDASFGSPARITAAVYPGNSGIVDIEREVALGQAIHSKGVMILNGYLGNRYAQQFPMAISASLAMEQSYGYIDGDSASMAELCCLISSLINVPIKQSFAITGSMNQHGEVQAVGGINEKIEGFFDLCNARGLTGEQGVIIPEANQRNLMLHSKVVDAVKAKQFHVYAVSHVDEAMELLMGMRVGTLNARGVYPKESINQRVMERLKQIAELAKEAG